MKEASRDRTDHDLRPFSIFTLSSPILVLLTTDAGRYRLQLRQKPEFKLRLFI
jgi:hypothetical protein